MAETVLAGTRPGGGSQRMVDRHGRLGAAAPYERMSLAVPVLLRDGRVVELHAGAAR